MFFAGDQPMDVANNPAVRFISKHMPVTRELHGQRFFVRTADPKTGKLVTAATPLFLALVVINLADLVFAVDSVPAIFAITTDTFIVYTSNIMAILGLRALYFALAAMVHRFHYLKYALAGVLVFIGAKIFVADFLLGGDKFPPAVSLGVTFGLIAAGIGYSLWRTRGAPEPDWPAGTGPDDPARLGSRRESGGTLPLRPGRNPRRERAGTVEESP
jgi:tellurite resistance protein TerC